MTAVIGPGDEGGARSGFLNYLRPRMRRVRCGHDRPLAIIEPFGAKAKGSEEEFERFWQFGYFDEDETFLLAHLETCCFNPAHAHRPGRAATEAIQSAVIETLRAVDAA